MSLRLNILFVLLITALAAGTAAQAENADSAKAARDLALTADADILAEATFKAAEKDLERADKLAAQGKDAGRQAAAYRDAADGFAAAELEAIGNNLFADARSAIREADKVRAKRYAPETLGVAREILSEAEAELAKDRTQLETPTLLAERAAQTARRAAAIATLAREKPGVEELVMEWECYLREAQEAVGIGSPADAEPAVMAEELRIAITELVDDEQQLRSDLADSRAYNAALESEIRELDARLGGATAERRELVMQLESQARTEEQFTQTENLFEDWEADVFRKSGNVVIRLVALEFASGSAKLDDSNTDLLAKVGKAIDVYPGCTIRMEGHTDSQGSARLNQRLSQNRADAVVEYLIENMKIAPTRMSAIGYGSERPVASNETKEGRAKNRRIDLVITP